MIVKLLAFLFIITSLSCSFAQESAPLSLHKDDLLEYYTNEQQTDGGFRVAIQTSSVLYNTQMLYLYKYLELESTKVKEIQGLFSYIWSEQNQDGSFSAYPGDGGSADVSMMVYLVSRMFQLESKEFKKLQNALKENKKLRKVSNLARPYLMLAGADRAVNCLYPIGLNTMLKNDDKLPWLRVLMYPLLYLYQTGGVQKVDKFEFKRGLGCLNLGLRSVLPSSKSDARILEWFLKHKNDLGMIFNYVPTTIPWVLALQHLKNKDSSLFHENNGDELIKRALVSMESFQVKSSKGLYQSPGEGSVAETVEVLNLLLDAKVDVNSSSVEKGLDYLYQIQNKNGGFGFSKHNKYFPDPDDTGLVVSLWQRVYKLNPNDALKKRIDLAINYILSRVNSDGGYGAWDIDDHVASWFRPVERRIQKTGLVVSESSIDATARVLLGLNDSKNESVKNLQAWKNAVNWLLESQNEDGSYLSTWMVGYSFGTASAMSAIATAIGESDIDQKLINEVLSRSISFLSSVQKNDGSFSEDYSSYLVGKSVIAKESSVAMTGIVLSRIMMFLELAPSYGEKLRSIVDKAINFLQINLAESGLKINDSTWTAVSFPKIEYAKYRYIHQVEAYRAIKIYESLYEFSE